MLGCDPVVPDPKDSPELNPAEQVWNHAKNRLARLFVRTKEEINHAIRSIMCSFRQT